jgi:hypothetical protein
MTLIVPSAIERFAVGAAGLLARGADIENLPTSIVHVPYSAQSDHQSHWRWENIAVALIKPSYRTSKLTAILVLVSTATPFSFKGFHRHCFTAITTALAATGFPFSTLMLEGSPALSISTSISVPLPTKSLGFASDGRVGCTIFKIFRLGGVQMIRDERGAVCCDALAALSTRHRTIILRISPI